MGPSCYVPRIFYLILATPFFSLTELRPKINIISYNFYRYWFLRHQINLLQENLENQRGISVYYFLQSIYVLDHNEAHAIL